MKKMLKGLDLFGTTFEFTIFGFRKFHSPVSIFLSIIFYTLTVSFTIVFGLDLINRKNPIVMTEIQNPINYTDFTLDSKKLTFAWRLENNDAITINYTGLIYPKLVYHNFQKFSNGTWDMDRFKVLDAEQCNSEFVTDKKFIDKFNLADWNCIDFSRHNISLGGYWDSTFVKYLELKLYYCPDGDLKSPLCTPIEALKESTSGAKKMFFSCIFPIHYFEPNNLNVPLGYEYYNYFTTLSANLQKMERLYLKNAYLDDDQGYFIKESNKSQQVSFEKFQNDVIFKPDNLLVDKIADPNIYSFIIYFSKTKEKYYRTYMKIQELAAFVGGFIKIVIVAGEILSELYNRYQINIKLINELFEFNENYKNNNYSNQIFIDGVGDDIKNVGNSNNDNNKGFEKDNPNNINKYINNVNNEKVYITPNDINFDNLKNNLSYNINNQQLDANRNKETYNYKDDKDTIDVDKSNSNLGLIKSKSDLSKNTQDENDIELQIQGTLSEKENIEDEFSPESIINDEPPNSTKIINTMSVKQNFAKDNIEVNVKDNMSNVTFNQKGVQKVKINENQNEVQNIQPLHIEKNINNINQQNERNGNINHSIEHNDNSEINRINPKTNKTWFEGQKPSFKWTSHFKNRKTKDALFASNNLQNRLSLYGAISPELNESLRISLQKQEINKTNTKFYFNIFNYFRKNIFNCGMNKNEIERSNVYDFVYHYVIEKLDVISYIKHFTKFEKLLLMNFNDMQHTSFEFFQKPNLLDTKELEVFDIEFDYRKRREENTSLEFKERLIDKEEKNKIRLLKYYIKKIKEDCLEPADEKLIELLDYKLKNIIVDCVYDNNVKT